MPIRNEATQIARSLEAVLSQDYPADRMEVIVADGGSTDGTREVVERLQRNHPNLRLIENPPRIVSTGLNAALAEMRGEVFVRVDGHCEIGRDYVRRCIEHLRNGVDAVGGFVETVGQTRVAQTIAAAMSSPFGVGDSAFRTVKNRTVFVDTVPFPAYSRRIMERTGLFDEELVRNQDDEYNYRLRGLGARILLASDVRSRYYSRSSLRSLWRQYFQYGYWKVRVMQKHPRQMKPRQFAPPVFAGLLLVSLWSGPWTEAGRWLFGIVAGVYLVSNLTASILSARKGNRRLLPLLPTAFATLHLSYGLGFLTGLLRFAGRWGDRQTHVSAVSVKRTGHA